MSEQVAYKVLTSAELARLEHEGSFAGSPADLADGFIHLSTADQLMGTIEQHFAGQHDIHLAAIDLTALGRALRWEPSRGGALFPHLYAPLLLETVIAYGPARGEHGAIKLPTAG